MIKSYFDLNKRKMFPMIKDWSSPQNKLRKANVRKLTWSEWFFFHPSAYHLINFGSNVSGSLSFGIVSLFLFKWGLAFSAIISLIISVALFANLIKKIKDYKLNKDMTFYDLWMREYR